ncbi:glycosyltransferase family 39 protein [Pedobacter sp. UYP30]|uniref:ArnT family glycosyltransferase n=1 Tax=Pedobacter sp. UYP30 TaxID=1756400 RepID=UPI003391B23D
MKNLSNTTDNTQILIGLTSIIILIRIIFIFFMGPMPQDAYYFLYSQHPSLSYFDHPAGIAVILRFFTSVFGNNTIAIKLADSVTTLGTVWVFYLLAQKFYKKEEAKKALLLLLSTLMVSILSLISTPDSPLLFFWALSLLMLHVAIFEDKKWFWVLTGIAMGLAFDSKYTAVFLPSGMILFLLLSNSKRKYLATIWPYLVCILFVLVAMPVIVWNIDNHFASFVFQGKERMQSVSSFHLTPRFFFGLVGTQLFLLIPILFLSLFYGLWKIYKIYGHFWNKLPSSLLFLLCFFLPVFVVFIVLSPIYWIKINWLMPSYIAGIIFVTSYVSAKWLKWQVVISVVLHVAMAIEIIFYVVPVRSDDTWFGWKDLATQTQEVEKQHGANFIFSADGYKTSAELSLFCNQFIYGQNVIGNPALQFDYIGTDLKALNGKTAIFIDSEPRFSDLNKAPIVPEKLSGYFKRVQQLEPILIYNSGKVVRKFNVFLCEDYHFVPPNGEIINIP